MLLCGELNGVPYDRKRKTVTDRFGLMAAIPVRVRVILNPTHDRMTRYEMPLKRAHCSKGRWFVSVWNKGRRDRRGVIKDGKRPAWDVFHDGERINHLVHTITDIPGIEIGILKVSN